MGNREDNFFDARFREVLKDGVEEVPAGLWDAIASELDKVERRKKRAVLFWKIAGGTGAVAAAVTALLLVVRPAGNGGDDAGSSLVAENVAAVAAVNDKAGEENAGAGNAADAAVAADDKAGTGVTGIYDEVRENVAAGNTAVAGGSASERNLPAADESVTLIGEVVAAEPKLLADNPKTPSSPVENAYEARKSGGKADGSEAGAKDVGEKPATFSGNELQSISERDFLEAENSGKKSMGVALALTGNTAVNTDRKVKNTRRFAPVKGIVATETTLVERTDNTIYHLPMTFGLGLKVSFAKRWAVGTGVNYTLLSKKVYADYTEVDEASGEITKKLSSNMRNDQHYVGVPLNLYFSIVKTNFWDFYAYAGGAVDKCIANKYRNLSGSEPFSYKRRTSGVQWSVNTGLGVEFRPTRYIGIFIDPCVSYYFDCKQPRSIRTRQPLTFNASAGLRFTL